MTPADPSTNSENPDSPRPRGAESRASRIFVRVARLVPFFLFGAIFIPNLGFVPLWDGRQYADALIQAAHFPVHLLDFNIFGHPSMLFMALVGLPQFFDSGNVFLLNAGNLIFGLAAVAAFLSIARKCFPGSGEELENCALAAVFAALPIVLSSELNLNSDTGVLAFSLLMVSALLGGRFGPAALASIFLIYSKESGLLLYPLILGVYLVVFVFLERMPVREMIRQVWKRSFGFVPVFVYFAVRTVERLTAVEVRWKGASRSRILDDFMTLGFSGAQDAYLAQLGIVNFNWILSAVVLSAIVLLVVRIVKGRNRAPAGADRRVLLYIIPLAAAVLHVLTRFRTFTNPRYLLPVYPFFVLCFAISLRFLTSRRGVRLAVMAGFLPLAIWSSFRTVDPVSRALYGTFPFGRHQLLHMTSLVGDCCGYSRDQLTYNLEYTRLGTVQNDVFAAIRPDASTVIVVDPTADWFVHGALDAKTFRRTLARQGSILPRYLRTDVISKMKDLPPEIYFIAYPNVDNSADLRWLPSLYDTEWVREFGEAGYTIPVLRLRKKLPEPANRLKFP